MLIAKSIALLVFAVHVFTQLVACSGAADCLRQPAEVETRVV